MYKNLNVHILIEFVKHFSLFKRKGLQNGDNEETIDFIRKVLIKKEKVAIPDQACLLFLLYKLREN